MEDSCNFRCSKNVFTNIFKFVPKNYTIYVFYYRNNEIKKNLKRGFTMLGYLYKLYVS